MGKISNALRLKVKERADCKCEYCKIHEEFLTITFQVDHIVSMKHGGGDEFENLAYTCQHCNQHKGSDLVTFLGAYQNLVPLFNPRIQVWEHHFEAKEGKLFPKTDIAEATIKLLKINNLDKIEFRRAFQELNLYP